MGWVDAKGLLRWACNFDYCVYCMITEANVATAAVSQPRQCTRHCYAAAISCCKLVCHRTTVPLLCDLVQRAMQHAWWNSTSQAAASVMRDATACRATTLCAVPPKWVINSQTPAAEGICSQA